MSNYLKNVRQIPLKGIITRVMEFFPKDAISVDKLEEWAYQAQESIAPRETYEIHSCYLEVNNNKALLPVGMFQLEMVLYKNLDFTDFTLRTNPYTTETPEFKTETDISTNITTDTTTTTTITTKTKTENVKLNSGMDNGLYKADPTGDITKTQLYYADQASRVGWRPLSLATNVFHNTVALSGANKDVYKNCAEAFSIQNGCIITTFTSGLLLLAYTGFSTTDEGEFLVPDYEDVKAAIESYLMRNYFKWKMITGNVSNAYNKYQMFNNEWNVLAPKATASMMMPDLIQYQNIRNMNKFIKEDSPFATVMGALNNTELLNFNSPRFNSSILNNYIVPKA